MGSSSGQSDPGNAASSGRRDAAETTRRLVEAAAEEFLAHGYERAGVNNIARRAGVTVGAIYTRWPSKSETMAAAVEHLLHQLLPDVRIAGLGLRLGEVPLPDLLQGWGASLIDIVDPLADVYIHAFSSARNDAAIAHCLKDYLDETADQLGHLIEQSKAEGTCDPGVSTAAAALFITALAVGVRSVVSAGLDDRHVPAVDEWVDLITRCTDATKPETQYPR